LLKWAAKIDDETEINIYHLTFTLKFKYLFIIKLIQLIKKLKLIIINSINTLISTQNSIISFY